MYYGRDKFLPPYTLSLFVIFTFYAVYLDTYLTPQTKLNLQFNTEDSDQNIFTDSRLATVASVTFSGATAGTEPPSSGAQPPFPGTEPPCGTQPPSLRAEPPASRARPGTSTLAAQPS